MDVADDMYREELLELYQHPQHKKKIKGNVQYHDYNPVCGDEVEIFLRVEKGTITDASFDGKGCAISQAAAELLIEHVTGKKTTDVLRINNDDMLKLLPIEVSNLRIKCALLTLKAVQKGIAQSQVV